MPYVPPEVKERIKREISVERLAEARGIQLKRSGKELIGLCPFHKDTNPMSRAITAERLRSSTIPSEDAPRNLVRLVPPITSMMVLISLPRSTTVETSCLGTRRR